MHLSVKDKCYIRVKCWKTNFQANGPRKQAGVAILISNKIHFQPKVIKKRHRLTDWIRKQDPTFCCIQKTHLSVKDKHYLRVKGWKTILQANGPRKEAGVAILISGFVNKTQHFAAHRKCISVSTTNTTSE